MTDDRMKLEPPSKCAACGRALPRVEDRIGVIVDGELVVRCKACHVRQAHDELAVAHCETCPAWDVKGFCRLGPRQFLATKKGVLNALAPAAQHDWCMQHPGNKHLMDLPVQL